MLNICNNDITSIPRYSRDDRQDIETSTETYILWYQDIPSEDSITSINSKGTHNIPKDIPMIKIQINLNKWWVRSQ